MRREDREKIEKALSYNIAKSNELILRSRYSLSLRQQRALDYAISKIKKGDPPDTVYTVDPKEAFLIVTGSDRTMGGKDAMEAYDAFRSLQYMPVELRPTDDVIVTCNWFHHVSLNKKTGVMEFRFHDLIAPHLFDLYENYSMYNLYFPYKMRTVYGPRLYLMLKANIKGRRRRGIELYVPLDAFKIDIGACLEAEKNKKGVYEVKQNRSYDQFGKLKQGVIDPAVKDINNVSDLQISYEVVKDGRKVTGLRFTINSDTVDSFARTLERLDTVSVPVKSKRASRFTPPTLEEVKAYASESNLNVDADKFYRYFTTPDDSGRTWIDSKGNPVRNWKQKMLTWANKGERRMKSRNTLMNYKEEGKSHPELTDIEMDIDEL